MAVYHECTKAEMSEKVQQVCDWGGGGGIPHVSYMTVLFSVEIRRDLLHVLPATIEKGSKETRHIATASTKDSLRIQGMPYDVIRA